jgi:CHAD domain-containing protein
MPLDARELDRRVQKLRKSLKGFPQDPLSEEVHDLRTRTRRVESILQSLDMTSSGNERKILARLKIIRRRSGKVRDMDE